MSTVSAMSSALCPGGETRAGPQAEHLDFQLEVNKSLMIQEGLCIPVSCTISYPRDGWNESTPACGYWFQKRDKPGMEFPMKRTRRNVGTPWNLNATDWMLSPADSYVEALTPQH
nr:sialic acid-binding Ig-like lectin 16 [Delphinus delphis]